ncbi:unnamed protein product [Malus baccata var. baccata]
MLNIRSMLEPFCCFFPHLKDAFVHYFHVFVVHGCSIWTELFSIFFSCFPLPSHRSRSLFYSSRPYPLSISVCGASPITACSVPLKPLKASSIRSLFRVYPVDFCFSFHCCLLICIASLILALSVCVQRHKICNKFPSIQEGCWVEFGYTDSAAVYHTKNLKNLEFFGFKAICSQRPRRSVLKRTSYRYRLNPQSQYNDLMTPNYIYLIHLFTRIISIFNLLDLILPFAPKYLNNDTKFSSQKNGMCHIFLFLFLHFYAYFHLNTIIFTSPYTHLIQTSSFFTYLYILYSHFVIPQQRAGTISSMTYNPVKTIIIV